VEKCSESNENCDEVRSNCRTGLWRQVFREEAIGYAGGDKEEHTFTDKKPEE